ncbi:hypothetical protein VOLCADRAFT_93196 [Volvox carteri f. nagariensis]|uniref:Uncharacterized protein n=1 Tax=Volvox carteri f. nagariensis TaxID=3068 RepID=D8U1J4_VOLCA|nr:uncharacterized protein VOLCADRAFT_93196 [Volvox carteri f. nagariensis]EFJ46422.1 hypothetical protein VOLCADRAFT_93196 [Volvox carteri f. nagariensis]|eukprot:XP_002952575.1 hypothetical protein VOLCADRAFT_93196 [Volvox carteri f. nagariensis]
MPSMVVLVPPFFQRDVRGLSRFCRSSYDYLGNRKQLSRLLRDHLSSDLCGRLLLSPPDDPRVSVRAKLRHAGGSMVLRWQPATATAVHTFLEMAANLNSPRGDVCVRGSYLHPGTGLGAFMVAPLERRGGPAAAEGAAQVGVRYSSTNATAGAIFIPRRGDLDKLWLVGAAGSPFTASVEMAEGGPLTFSFFQHVAVTRQVVNPFEEDELGSHHVQTHTHVYKYTHTRRSRRINKNWLLKGRVGSQCASAAVGARVWHAVSAYLTACVEVDFARPTSPRYGVELCVENFGPLQYERGADDVAVGRALLQRHEASPQDLDNFAGRGVLVRRNAQDHGGPSDQTRAQKREVEEAARRRVAELM